MRSRPANADTSTSSQSTVEQGRKLFLVGCSSCHGQNGEGIVTKRGTNYGPPLVGVGAAAVDFQVGTGRMPMVQSGAPVQKKNVAFPINTALVAPAAITINVDQRNTLSVAKVGVNYKFGGPVVAKY